MNAQLTFGLMSGETKVDPYAPGDVVVRESGERYVVQAVEQDAAGRNVLVCVNQKTGADAIWFEREIAYRSR